MLVAAGLTTHARGRDGEHLFSLLNRRVMELINRHINLELADTMETAFMKRFRLYRGPAC